MGEITLTHAGWHDPEEPAGGHDTDFVIIAARDVIPLLRWAIAHPGAVEDLAPDEESWLRDSVMRTVIHEDSPEVDMQSDGPCMTGEQQWALTEKTVIPWEQAILWYCRVLMYLADMNATNGEITPAGYTWLQRVSDLHITTREQYDARSEELRRMP